MNKEEIYKNIEQHYRDNYSRFIKAIGRMIGNYHDAEDVVQETYTRACEYWSSYRIDDNFNGWINQILKNAFLNKMKDVKSHGMFDELSKELTINVTPNNKIYLEQIIKIIDTQPEKIKTVLYLYFINKYSAEEVSRVTDYAPQSVWNIVSKFREYVKEK